MAVEALPTPSARPPSLNHLQPVSTRLVSLLYAITWVVLWLAILYAMFRKGVIIKV